ncbi:MAG TPA: hypothetical protein VFT37_14350 [Telluria sp.]|nr:hypothetical protein [Telluria sp.]
MFNFHRLMKHVPRPFPAVLLCAGALAWAQSPTPAAIGIVSPPDQALDAREKQAVVTALLATSTVADQIRGHKVRAIRVRHGFVATPSGAKQQEYRAIVTLFDYTMGRATEYGLDPGTGELVSQETLRGRPQASDEEIQAASRIVRRDPALARLLATPASLAGGFVVDAPEGKPASHRCLQMRIFSRDFSRTLRVVVVDLTDDTVASST